MVIGGAPGTPSEGEAALANATGTTIRRAELTLPGVAIGPENPLPALRPLDEMHAVDERTREGLPRDMARQIGYEPLHSVLPVRILDGYERERSEITLDTLVIENDRLRATVLPGLGGRVHSLRHKPTGRELLYRNPVFQPADFALNGAWFSGGIEWNIGATGHTTLSCAPVHAARVPAPDGGEMLRLWEWERLRDLPFQVDLWLPDGSDFLYVGVRIRNPHEKPAPAYWWSNIAVPEEHRVLVPADEAWHFGYERTLRRVPAPEFDGADRTYPLRSEYPADYFYEVPDGERRWIAALDDDGHGLVQTSTDLLRGRKLFLWGAGTGGRRWQSWLTEPGTGGYAEIQAGLARTQLEHVKLDAESEFAWLEAYGPIEADPAPVHGTDWAAARAEVAGRLEAALPRTAVDTAYEAWRAAADTDPGERLATGSGWGALEVLRTGRKLPGTPFDESTLGDDQAPWLELLRNGAFPAPRKVVPPGPSLVAPGWRDMLETAPAEPFTEYHLGIAQWHAGDLAQAVRSWERGLELAPSQWPLLRCLAVADRVSGHAERAADRYAEAFDDLCAERRDDGESWTAATAALGREAIEALLAVGRTQQARHVWDGLRPENRERGRFRLLLARLLLAEGDKKGARAVFDAGFEVADLREGAEVLGETWARLTDEPLPDHYEFRMRPPAAT
ncbi:DUF5107 domain-containing protein [Streptomyces monticola]|uniref:DUF5107 domain-containing protein n=1 Tax=Streptomyces monticola TaxID=2666263 RepID=A0ABW2JBE3_9ACTN